jgi:hypothetical protein
MYSQVKRQALRQHLPEGKICFNGENGAGVIRKKSQEFLSI